MEQYIKKSDLVAEIEKLKERYNKCLTCNNYEDGLKDGRMIGYEDSLHKINSLEVKEVNYERELSKYVSNGIHRFFPNVDDDYCKMDRVIWQDYDVIKVAKHFFELGLFSQLTWKDIRLISEIGEEFMNSEESDDLSEEEYYTMILNKLKEKGRNYKTGRQEIRDLAQKGEKV